MPKFIRRLSSGSIFVLHSHTGYAAIEYTYIIGERSSKYLEPEFSIANRGPNGDKLQFKTLFLSVFDPRLSIVKSVFDCHLFGVPLVRNDFETFITGYAIILGVR